jgi:hypothetical protein
MTPVVEPGVKVPYAWPLMVSSPTRSSAVRDLKPWLTPPDRVAHPARLSAVAQLASGRAPQPAWQYLQIGSGDGGHLFGLAATYPESTFVGVEPNEALRDAATNLAAQARLANLRFEDDQYLVGAEATRRFDFVVWLEGLSALAKPARPGHLQRCRDLLSQCGLALLGYEVLPGARTATVARGVLRRAVDSAEHASASHLRDALAVLCDAPAGGRGVELLRSELDALRALDDQSLVRALEIARHPTSFRDFAQELTEAGLLFLGEATQGAIGPGFAKARAFLRDCSDPLEREQYVDIVSGRRSRRSLVARAGVALSNAPLAERLSNIWCLSPLRLLAVGESRTFVAPGGTKVQVADPTLAAVLTVLGLGFPRAVIGSDLPGQMMSVLGRLPSPATTAAAVAIGYELELLDLMSSPPRCASTIAERPRTSLLSRVELTNDRSLTSCLHFQVRPRNAQTLALIPLLDGTRTIPELLRDLADHGAGSDVSARGERLRVELEQLARQGLLVEE